MNEEISIVYDYEKGVKVVLKADRAELSRLTRIECRREGVSSWSMIMQENIYGEGFESIIEMMFKKHGITANLINVSKNYKIYPNDKNCFKVISFKVSKVNDNCCTILYSIDNGSVFHVVNAYVQFSDWLGIETAIKSIFNAECNSYYFKSK